MSPRKRKIETPAEQIPPPPSFPYETDMEMEQDRMNAHKALDLLSPEYLHIAVVGIRMAVQMEIASRQPATPEE